MFGRDCSFEIGTDPSIIDTIEGETFAIKCMVLNDPINQYRNWTKCRWERMSDGSYCHSRYHQIIGTGRYEVLEKCEGLDDHWFFGQDTLYWGKGNPYCGLNINPTSVKDRGDWRCSLTFEDTGDEEACITTATVRAKVIMLMYGVMAPDLLLLC